MFKVIKIFNFNKILPIFFEFVEISNSFENLLAVQVTKVKNVKPETAYCQLKKKAIIEAMKPKASVQPSQAFIDKMFTSNPNAC